MRDTLKAIREAYRLWKTDSRMDTYLAVVVLAFGLAPFVITYWKLTRGGQSRER